MSIWNLSDKRYHKLLKIVNNVSIGGFLIIVGACYVTWIIGCVDDLKWIWALPFFLIPLGGIILSTWLSSERTDYFDEDDCVDQYKLLKNENERLHRQIRYLKKTKNLNVL